MQRLQSIARVALLSVLLMVVVPYLAEAQNSMDKIKSMKIAFITNKLTLTPDESKVFWPLYDQYYAERKDARTEIQKDESLAKADIRIAIQEKDLEIQKKFNSKFKEILNEDRVAQLYDAEGEFMKMLREAHAKSKQP